MGMEGLLASMLDAARANPYVAVLLSALIPSFEARYSFLLGVKLGLNPLNSFIASTMGAVALSILLAAMVDKIDKILSQYCTNHGVYAVKRLSCLYVDFSKARARKLERYVESLGIIGLIIFVAIPLPGSGIYTGAVAALLLGIRGAKLLLGLVIGGILSIIIVAFSAGIIGVVS